ncbi:MAG: hypothetical protein F6K14_10640 [Symploca sp. SIO2C1]|nr:hypothetical protein [Symploca sp. SIO2C1]
MSIERGITKELIEMKMGDEMLYEKHQLLQEKRADLQKELEELDEQIKSEKVVMKEKFVKDKQRFHQLQNNVRELVNKQVLNEGEKVSSRGTRRVYVWQFCSEVGLIELDPSAIEDELPLGAKRYMFRHDEKRLNLLN